MKCLFAPILCLLLSACGGDSARESDNYSSDDVEIKAEGYTDHGIELRFVTPPETLYYCPGIDLAYDGEKVRYSYIRSHIDRTPSVDAKADHRNGESVVVIPFPPDEDRIELIDSSGKSLGAWQSSPKE